MGERLKGRKIIVFGASSGIGRACAIQLGGQGANVILVGRNMERLGETASHIPEGRSMILTCDVSDFDAARKVVTDAVKLDGMKLDGCLFAVGICITQPIISIRYDDLIKLFQTNFFAFVAVLKEFSSRRVSNNGASFVSISSCAALRPDKGQGIYAATKAAINAYTVVAAQELAARKIRVNTICPDVVDTPMGVAGLQRLTDERLQKRFPFGVIMPEDIADTALFLLESTSRKITGQAFSITAGSVGGDDQFAF